MILKFTCPKCGEHRLEETMIDVCVISEIAVIFDDGTCEYGEQTNENGKIENILCSGCGFILPGVESYEELAEFINDKRELKMRTIEMGVALGEREWNTYLVEIPVDTPDDQIEAEGRVAVVKMMGSSSLVGSFLYNSMDDECPEQKKYPLVGVDCKLCGEEVDATTAHRHQDGWVGECCWDERLRSSE